MVPSPVPAALLPVQTAHVGVHASVCTLATQLTSVRSTADGTPRLSSRTLQDAPGRSGTLQDALGDVLSHQRPSSFSTWSLSTPVTPPLALFSCWSF